MTQDQAIFDFELDFAGALRCIPMAGHGARPSQRNWGQWEGRRVSLQSGGRCLAGTKV